MDVWIIVYSVKIGRWRHNVLAGASLEEVEAKWEALKDRAMSGGHDYDLLFKSQQPERIGAAIQL